MKKSVRNRLVTGLVGLTLAVGLTGCSNDDEETLGDTIDASDTESLEYVPASADGPAQNVPEPNLPAVATENSEEGAEATLEYFWEATQYARLTGESHHLELISTSECDFCGGYIDDWQSTYDAGQWAVPHGEVEYEVSDSWFGFDVDYNADTADILFSLTEPAIDLYASNGDLRQESPGSEEATQWFALLLYDATAQRWEIEWIGAEDLVDWRGE